MLFLATATERISDKWTDPADLGGDVHTVTYTTQKLAVVDALNQARAIAERAVDIEDEDQERPPTTSGRGFSGAGDAGARLSQGGGQRPVRRGTRGGWCH